MSIKEVIKEKGWTLAGLCEKLPPNKLGNPVTPPALSQIINGNPQLSKLREIADVMGITVGELIDEQPTSPNMLCPHCGKPINITINKE